MSQPGRRIRRERTFKVVLWVQAWVVVDTTTLGFRERIYGRHRGKRIKNGCRSSDFRLFTAVKKIFDTLRVKVCRGRSNAR